MNRANAADLPSGVNRGRRPQPLPIARLDPNPFQLRQVIDDDELVSLTDSIRIYGLSGHLEARLHPSDPGRLQILFGHRRTRACKLLGLTEMPVAVGPRIDDEMRCFAYIENVTQVPLTYWEEGLHFDRMRADLGLSMVRIAGMTGKSKGYVQNRLDVPRLPVGSPLREAAEFDAVAMTSLVGLLNLQPAEQAELFEQLQRGDISSDHMKMLKKARARSLPLPEEQDGTELRSWTAIDHVREALRLLEKATGKTRHHARLADFGSLAPEELRRVRDAYDELRELFPF